MWVLRCRYHCRAKQVSYSRQHQDAIYQSNIDAKILFMIESSGMGDKRSGKEVHDVSVLARPNRRDEAGSPEFLKMSDAGTRSGADMFAATTSKLYESHLTRIVSRARANLTSIRREELHSPESSPRSSPDPDLTALLRSRVQAEYTFTTAEYDAEDQDAVAASGGDEAELRLFAAPPNDSQSHKIRLSSPDAGPTEPGFAVKKPRSYYFAEDVTSDQEKELRSVAVSGDTVVQMSKVPWPGCALSWKVRTITPAGLKKVVVVGHPPTMVTVAERTGGRRRKGKKTRMALRKKVQAAKEKEARQAEVEREREATEREKKTRKNREKKVKKKAREKAKKLAEADANNPPESTTGNVG